MSDEGYDPQQPPAQPPVPPEYPPPAAPPEYPSPAQPPAYPPPGAPPAYPPAQPPAAPPQAYAQPGQPAQPPAYQPPPGYFPEQAAPPQPPAKKGKGGVIGMVIAIVALCAIVSCGAVAFSLLKGGSPSKSELQQAETHFSAAVESVKGATASLESLNEGDPSASEVSEAVSEADDALRSARDEIAAAKTIADQWKDTQGKADYLAGLTATTETLDLLQDLVAYVDTASGMLGKAKQAGKETEAGNDDLNAAVKAGNRSSYSTMRKRAQSAQTHYTKAAVLFREAHKLDKSAGLDKAAKYCDLRKKQADVVERMGVEGAARRLSAYNADIKKMNAYGKDAEKVGLPAIVSDRNWAQKRLADLQDDITAASKKVDEYREKAIKEFGFAK